MSLVLSQQYPQKRRTGAEEVKELGLWLQRFEWALGSHPKLHRLADSTDGTDTGPASHGPIVLTRAEERFLD